MDMQNKELIWNAAHVTPAPRQLAWQEMELTAFIHFYRQYLYRQGMGRRL